MRVRTAFGRLAEATQERLFGAAFVLLRVVLGAECLAAGLSLSQSDFKARGLDALLTSLTAGILPTVSTWILIGMGAALVLGLFTRPAGLLGAVLFGYAYALDILASTTPDYLTLHLPLIALCLLFATGGAGHAFGLNGLVLRNLRYPGPLARFFYG